MLLALLIAAQDGDLMPLDAGREWEFHAVMHDPQGGDHESDFTVTVSEGDNEGETRLDGSFIGVWGLHLIFMIEGQGMEEPPPLYDTVRRTDEGLRIVRVQTPDEEMDFGDGWLWIASQVEEGHAWRDETAFENDTMTSEFTWGAVEEVTVQAGVFQARRLEFTLHVQDEGEGIAGTMWLAPGTGPVKIEWRMQQDGGPDRGSFEATLTRTVVPEEEG